MSGQGPLLRIGMTCAAIVLGSAFVGAQLSTTGDLSQVAASVHDEEEAGPAEDNAAARSGDEVADEGLEDDVEEPAEVTDGGSDEDPAASEGDEAPEGGAGDQVKKEEADEESGFAVVRRNP